MNKKINSFPLTNNYLSQKIKSSNYKLTLLGLKANGEIETHKLLKKDS